MPEINDTLTYSPAVLPAWETSIDIVISYKNSSSMAGISLPFQVRVNDEIPVIDSVVIDSILYNMYSIRNAIIDNAKASVNMGYAAIFFYSSLSPGKRNILTISLSIAPDSVDRPITLDTLRLKPCQYPMFVKANASLDAVVPMMVGFGAAESDGRLYVDGDTTITSESAYDCVCVERTGRLTADAKITVSGNMSIEPGGLVTHSEHNLNGLQLDIGGSLLIKEDSTGVGKIDVSGKGLWGGGKAGNTFGERGETININDEIVAGAAYGAGGSHGGHSFFIFGSPFSNSPAYAFGIVEAVEFPGGGGSTSNFLYGTGGDGGGFIHVNANAIHLEGSIKADGEDASGSCYDFSSGYGGGAGGGIYIITESLLGSGLISANGGIGVCNEGSGGGGGRVVVQATTFDDFTDRITVFGGKNNDWDIASSAGSIYTVLSVPDSIPDTSNYLIINNNGDKNSFTPLYTDLPYFDSILVKDGTLGFVNDFTLNHSLLILDNGNTFKDGVEPFVVEETGEITGSGFLMTMVVNRGLVFLEDDNLVADHLQIDYKGKLSGSGTIVGYVENTGTIAPEGALSISQLVQKAAGICEMTVRGGPSSGVNDKLEVGSAVLDGILDIDLLGYTPWISDSIVLIQGGNIIDTFKVVDKTDNVLLTYSPTQVLLHGIESTMEVNPADLIFYMQEGGELPRPDTIFINGPDSVSWSLEKTGSWFQVDKTSGVMPDTVIVTVSDASLSKGIYIGGIRVEAPSLVNPTQVVEVSLHVDPSVEVKSNITRAGDVDSISIYISHDTILALFIPLSFDRITPFFQKGFDEGIVIDSVKIGPYYQRKIKGLQFEIDTLNNHIIFYCPIQDPPIPPPDTSESDTQEFARLYYSASPTASNQVVSVDTFTTAYPAILREVIGRDSGSIMFILPDSSLVVPNFEPGIIIINRDTSLTPMEGMLDTDFDSLLFVQGVSDTGYVVSILNKGGKSIPFNITLDSGYYQVLPLTGKTPAEVQVVPVDFLREYQDYLNIYSGLAVNELKISLRTVPGTVIEDNVFLPSVAVVPGSKINVPVTFSRACYLRAVGISFQWATAYLFLDSISFGNSVLGYADIKETYINNGSRQAAVRCEVGNQSLLPPGDSNTLVCLHYSLSHLAEAGNFELKVADNIDNIPIIDKAVFYVSDCNGTATEVVPHVDTSTVTVNRTGYNFKGRVIEKNTEKPVSGANLSFFVDYPSSAATTTFTSSDGSFEATDLNLYIFNLRVNAENYYPNMEKNLEVDDSGLTVVLTPVDTFNFTPHSDYVEYYCNNNTVQGYPVPVGSYVEVYDIGLQLVGQVYVEIPGVYGPVAVYRDNPLTISSDEGVVPGEEIRFFIDGQPATTDMPVIYPDAGSSPPYPRNEVCLTIAREPFICQLSENWNLISWNIENQVTDLEQLLGTYLSNIDFILGFKDGGLTYTTDPELHQFSTLHELNYSCGYWIKVKKGMAFELTIEGDPLPAGTKIPLSAGWNLVSYLPKTEMAAEQALSTVLAGDNLVEALAFGDIMQIYRPGWLFNTLNRMIPNHGYWLHVRHDDYLTYPVFSGAAGETGERLKEKAVHRTSASDIVITPFWMNLYARRLTLDDRVVPSGTSISACSPSGKLIGKAVTSADGKFGFMPVYADYEVSANNTGLHQGERFYLEVDGQLVRETVVWNEHGGITELVSLTSGDIPMDELPHAYMLYQNYPNPFNAATVVEYALPETAEITLTVYNILGQHVATLDKGVKNPGTYRLSWEACSDKGEPLATGIYFLRLKTDCYTSTKKMLLEK
ncbi:MAG: T9SS type A sorting domain-containing protein [candidate division Zixibacteria bacterium]|nr:T9SS type A sorting domain-containing protein [candidate division Zixibacteria bacterium]